MTEEEPKGQLMDFTKPIHTGCCYKTILESMILKHALYVTDLLSYKKTSNSGLQYNPSTITEEFELLDKIIKHFNLPNDTEFEVYDPVDRLIYMIRLVDYRDSIRYVRILQDLGRIILRATTYKEYLRSQPILTSNDDVMVLNTQMRVSFFKRKKVNAETFDRLMSGLATFIRVYIDIALRQNERNTEYYKNMLQVIIDKFVDPQSSYTILREMIYTD